MRGMLALIQRVSEASVAVAGAQVAAIGPGLLALVAVQPDDGEPQVARMAQRLLGYRLFADATGRMNWSLADTGGGLLLVSQFTLVAYTRSGMRPSLDGCAEPLLARTLFERLVSECRSQHAGPVQTGRFGAHMQVALVNDGPVTFLIEA